MTLRLLVFLSITRAIIIAAGCGKVGEQVTGEYKAG